MHGRLKVKTTAEKEAEKQKERSAKQKIYLAGFNVVFQKRKENIHDKEGLKISAQLLAANPDALTLWNIRRESMLAMKGEDEKAWRSLVLDDLKTTEYCLTQNPKSYGAWHHRDWIFRVIPDPPFEDEIQLCDSYLQLDERNFHCWDHRRLILSRCSHRSVSDELRYTQDLIEKNFSNYSAWHYRSKLLPLVHPPRTGTHLPIQEEVFIQELERVVTAVFTDPSDQSPWFFLRWLLNPRQQGHRLLKMGVMDFNEVFNLIFIFDQETSTPESDLSVCVNGQPLPSDGLKPHRTDDKHIWLLPLQVKCERLEISVDHPQSSVSCKLEFDPTEGQPRFKWLTNDPFWKGSLSENTRKTLEQIIENCSMLDELDPGNKWVLLTLVNVMSMLDLGRFEPMVMDYLTQLEAVDPLRLTYYKDIRSKLQLEWKISSLLESTNEELDVSSMSLTRIAHSHLLSSVKKINLSHNPLRTLDAVASFLNCEHLVLDGIPITHLEPLKLLPRLRVLSIKSCGVANPEVLKGFCSLECLEVDGNPILLQKEQIDDQLKSIIPSLKEINLGKL